MASSSPSSFGKMNCLRAVGFGTVNDFGQTIAVAIAWPLSRRAGSSRARLLQSPKGIRKTGRFARKSPDRAIFFAPPSCSPFHTGTASEARAKPAPVHALSSSSSSGRLGEPSIPSKIKKRLFFYVSRSITCPHLWTWTIAASTVAAMFRQAAANSRSDLGPAWVAGLPSRFSSGSFPRRARRP